MSGRALAGWVIALAGGGCEQDVQQLHSPVELEEEDVGSRGGGPVELAVVLRDVGHGER